MKYVIMARFTGQPIAYWCTELDGWMTGHHARENATRYASRASAKQSMITRNLGAMIDNKQAKIKEVTA